MKPTTISASSSPAAAIAAATSIATANFSSRVCVCRLSRPYRSFPGPFTAIPIPAASTQHGRIKNRHALLVCQLIAEPHTTAQPQPQPQPQPAPPASPQIAAASSGSSYTSMRDDPLSFWANEHTPLLRRRQAPATQDKKEEEEAAFLVAELRLLANAAADRAEMHGILATQRDNWNKLFQHTLTAASMTATVLAAVSGAMAANAAHISSASLTLPAALLNAGAGAMMSVINQFQPSQLAEEQRTAARLFRKLVSDIHYAIHTAPHLRQPSAILLRDCRRRLHALDKAFPMPLTPGGLEKFPSQMLPPLLIAPLVVDRPSAAHNQKRSEEEEEAGISGGWNAELEAELRGVAARLRRSDINTYTSWARNLVKINKSLAIAAPMLAAAAALLNVAQPVLVAAGQMVAIQHLGVMAAACSAMAAFAGSFSNDMQMGMVAELYRNSAGYYANIEGSINEALDAPAEEREHGELFRQRVAYELGRSPTASALIPAHTDTTDTQAPAGTLF